MSNWTHMLCDDCWNDVEPGRTPVRVKHPQLEVCCKCGILAVGAIPYRMDPESGSYCDHDGERVKGLLDKVAYIDVLATAVNELNEAVLALKNQQQETTQ